MTANRQKPTGEAWAKIPRELLSSDAWRSLGINGRRFVDFLLIEHMNKRGKCNGRLHAPRRQLEEFGISARHVSKAIAEAGRLGLVDCKRGVGRRASVYTLTWLLLPDGTAPTNRWREYRTKVLNNDFRREVAKGIRREVISPVGVSEGKSLTPESRVSEGKHPSRYSYQGGAVNSEGAGALAGRGAEVHTALLTALGGGPATSIEARCSPGKPSNGAAPASALKVAT